MSKTRWDRNRAARSSRIEASPVSLVGGLDQRSSARTAKPGRLLQCTNWEAIYGEQGYRRIDGYERYDGRTAPSEGANYSVMTFHSGSVEFTAGLASNLAGTATCYIRYWVVESGDWGTGDAAGYILMLSDSVTGTWGLADRIYQSAVERAYVDLPPQEGQPSDSNYIAYSNLLSIVLRLAIAAPAGAGSIIGGAVFNGAVYVIRNAASGGATLWKSSSSGWVSVATGLHTGLSLGLESEYESGYYQLKVMNFSGDPDDACLYGVNGRGRLFRVDRFGNFTRADPIFDTEATSTSSVTVGTGAKTFTVVEPARGWATGDSIIISLIGTPDVYMCGTVTSYNSGTGALVVNVVSISGAGTHTSWEIGMQDGSDKPFLMTEHKNHLFLAYPNGQVMSSELGSPMDFTGGTSATWGVSAAITGLESLKGKALGIFCDKRIEVISGSSSLDWDKETYSATIGAIFGTTQEVDGNVIFLSTAGGMTTLRAVQAYGDLEAALFSQDVKKELDSRRGTVIGSRMARNRNQYRLYFDDGHCLRFTINGTQPTENNVAATMSRQDDVPTVIFSGVIDGVECMFFGSTDGMLYHEDMGRSFDGGQIDAGIQLAWDHCKSPMVDKQFHKMELEVTPPVAGSPPITIYQQFDGSDGNVARTSQTVTVTRQDAVNAEYGSTPNPYTLLEVECDGIARGMSISVALSSASVDSMAIHTLMTYFTKLGARP